MGGIRIHLWGIDAPDMKQPVRADGQTYECGRDSAAVETAVSNAKAVTEIGMAGSSPRTESGEINSAIVRRGWAVDYAQYSHGHYRADEDAKAEGLWYLVSRASASRCQSTAGHLQASADGASALNPNRVSAPGRARLV
jgi:endonuclease YncB( thermonuclease family)